VRQAMVLTWMMMPRAGGRDFKDTRKIIARVFERNLAAWDEDNVVFSGPPPKKARKAPAKQKRATKPKKPTKKTVKKKKK
jgi:hypothetical protein